MTYFNPDVKTLAFLVDSLHGQDFVIIKKENTDEIRKGQPTTKIEAARHKITDLSDDMIRNAFMEALFEGKGLVGFLQGNKLAFGKGAELLSQRNVVITARRQPRDQEDTTTQSAANRRQSSLKAKDVVTSQDEDSNKSQSSTEPMFLDEELVSADEDAGEVESFTSFEIIPDEIYQRFLAQFKKLIQPDRSERESAPHRASQSAASIIKEDISKTTKRLTSPTQMKSEKQTSTKEEGVEKSEKRGIEERARATAAKEKDEKAKEKLRRFIETDLAKTENKAAEINRGSISHQEIDKAILDEMLENNEISEEAMKKIIDCANVDEKFLDDMLKAQPPLIDNRAYDKLMNIISPEK